VDLYKAIRSLYEEKKRLDRLIQSLEKIQARAAATELDRPRSRRGRRGMSADERQQVSERMKRYWAGRRAQAAANQAAAPTEPERAGAAAAGAGGSGASSVASDPPPAQMSDAQS